MIIEEVQGNCWSLYDHKNSHNNDINTLVFYGCSKTMTEDVYHFPGTGALSYRKLWLSFAHFRTLFVFPGVVKLNLTLGKRPGGGDSWGTVDTEYSSCHQQALDVIRLSTGLSIMPTRWKHLTWIMIVTPQFFFLITNNILTCHSRKRTGVNNQITDDWITSGCFSFMFLVLCMLVHCHTAVA